MFTKITAIAASLAIAGSIAGISMAAPAAVQPANTDSYGSGICVTVTHADDPTITSQKGDCGDEATTPPVIETPAPPVIETPPAVERVQYIIRGVVSIDDTALASTDYHLKITSMKKGSIVYEQRARTNLLGDSSSAFAHGIKANALPKEIDSYKIELAINGQTYTHTTQPSDALKESWASGTVSYYTGYFTFKDGTFTRSATN